MAVHWVDSKVGQTVGSMADKAAAMWVAWWAGQTVDSTADSTADSKVACSVVLMAHVRVDSRVDTTAVHSDCAKVDLWVLDSADPMAAMRVDATAATMVVMTAARWDDKMVATTVERTTDG